MNFRKNLYRSELTKKSPMTNPNHYVFLFEIIPTTVYLDAPYKQESSQAVYGNL